MVKFSLNPLKKPLTRKIFTKKNEPFFKTSIWQNCSSGQLYHLKVEVLQTCSAFFVCISFSGERFFARYIKTGMLLFIDRVAADFLVSTVELYKGLGMSWDF